MYSASAANTQLLHQDCDLFNPYKTACVYSTSGAGDSPVCLWTRTRAPGLKPRNFNPQRILCPVIGRLFDSNYRQLFLLRRLGTKVPVLYLQILMHHRYAVLYSKPPDIFQHVLAIVLQIDLSPAIRECHARRYSLGQSH